MRCRARLCASDLGADSGDIGRDALVPASYFSYQLSSAAVIGLSINAPFGLGTKTNEIWAGQTQSRENKLETYNFAPTIGYRIVPGLIVGAGVQVEYIRAKLRAAAPTLLFSHSPMPRQKVTMSGSASRSERYGSQELAPQSASAFARPSITRSTVRSVSMGFGQNGVTADLQTPEIVTLSLRQALAKQWTALATVEWTNWSRLDKLDTVCEAPGPPFCVGGAGSTVNSLALGWHDGWLFSGGLEYAYSRELTLRGGVAYELSPIQNPDERIAALPDANRIWVSGGASYALNMCGTWCDSSVLDLAYVHLFVEDASINRTENGITLLADTQGSADVISIGLKTRWGGAGRAVEPIM